MMSETAKSGVVFYESERKLKENLSQDFNK
jgi:hypothetical protein